MGTVWSLLAVQNPAQVVCLVAGKLAVSPFAFFFLSESAAACEKHMHVYSVAHGEMAPMSRSFESIAYHVCLSERTKFFFFSFFTCEQQPFFFVVHLVHSVVTWVKFSFGHELISTLSCGNHKIVVALLAWTICIITGEPDGTYLVCYNLPLCQVVDGERIAVDAQINRCWR